MGRAAEVAGLLRGEQARLVAAFEEVEGGAFGDSEWRRAGLGGGQARILDGGRVLERAGVNASLVHGGQVPASVADGDPELAGRPFTATGLSLVLHPRNPYAPSFHANFRFFAVEDTWWFGGGCDMTPMYGFTEDAVHFHTALRRWCGRHEVAEYAKWKAACDEYFTIPHRAEMRGLGGVFFDRLTDSGPDGFERCLALATDGLRTLLPAYLPILNRRRALPYGERERNWQNLRRGRYVEFNLVYDRGTRFGLETRGNAEAILMSLPPHAGWAFEAHPEPGSPEAEVAAFLQPRDWTAR